MHLSKKERAELKMKFGGKCAYCGCLLGEKWHADHVKPVMRDWEFVKNENGYYVTKNGITQTRSTGKLFRPENECRENMFPACVPCNIDKGANDLEGWRLWLQDRIVNGLRRNSSTFRHAERFGRVTITPGPMVFWFEKYEQQEASDATQG